MLDTVPADRGRRAGLGIFAYELSCGTAWGHGGDVPGYHTRVITTADGARQVAITVNIGAGRSVRTAVSAALEDTLCG